MSPSLRATVLALLAVACMLSVSGEAASAASAVVCPTVDASTGSVTPAPSPGVDWSGCDLAGAYLPSVDLTGADLSGADMSTVYMPSANLTGVDLANVNLSYSYLVSANFTNADLASANLNSTTLTSGILTGAGLDEATFTDANVNGLVSGAVTGTPATLPSGWVLVDGYLLGSQASAENAALSGANLAGVDLSQADLTNADLSGATLTSTDFQYATLSGAKLASTEAENANFSSVNLQNADLSAADLSGANLSQANLTSADLSKANLTFTNLGSTDLSGANLTGLRSGNITDAPDYLPANWSLAYGYLWGPGGDYSGDSPLPVPSSADLASTDFSDATISTSPANDDFTGANFSDATLNGDFSTDTLVNVNVAGADLSGATFTSVTDSGITGTPAKMPSDWMLVQGRLVGPGALLQNVSLAGTDLAGADLQNAFLNGTDFSGANLTGANLTGAEMIGVKSGGVIGQPTMSTGWAVKYGYIMGSEAELAGARLAGSDLSGLELYGVDLTGADLAKANLNADLTGATLTGANLAGAAMSAAKLSGVISGEIAGMPASLPANWSIHDSYLFGYEADLTGADLHGANLANMNLDYIDLNNADLSGADLRGATLTKTSFGTGANFSGADLDGADASAGQLEGSNFTAADLQSMNLDNADLDQDNLTGANLTGANVSGATFNEVTWSGTICPDGSSSDYYADGCFSSVTVTTPSATPAVTAGTPGLSGWYTTPVTVSWHWVDSNALVPASCPATATSTGQGLAVTAAGSCLDADGHTGTASVALKVDTRAPAVTVIGVRDDAVYAAGGVPRAACATTDAVSGVLTSAVASVSGGPPGNAGMHTVTCAGAEDKAGNKTPAVRIRYTVAYGFGGFSVPRAGTTISARARKMTVRFRLTVSGKSVSATLGRALAREHRARATLTGPGIKPVTAICGWNAKAQAFTCTINLPRSIRTGRSNAYTLRAAEKIGSDFLSAPATGHGSNPEVIYFH
jgi:uncharacterized protein YjbI with pentapeptide repeats